MLVSTSPFWYRLTIIQTPKPPQHRTQPHIDCVTKQRIRLSSSAGRLGMTEESRYEYAFMGTAARGGFNSLHIRNDLG